MRVTGQQAGRRFGVAIVLSGALCAGLVAPVPHVAGASAAQPELRAASHTGGGLRLVGRSDLGGGGLNGEVAIVGTTAVVGGGVVTDTGDHTERYNPFPCLTASVKIVDLSDPNKPRVASTIPLAPGVAAIDVAALRVSTPTFTGDLAALALDDGPSHEGPSRCSPSPATTERGVAYYDVTNPAAPVLLGRYQADADDVPADAPPCGPPNNTTRCATGQHSVDLVQRADGRVLSLSSEPLATHPVRTRPSGDLRIVDVTNPRSPVQVGDWPKLGDRLSPFSSNGCRRFTNNHSVADDAGGTRALVAYMDGGLFNLDIADPAAIGVVGRFSYPPDRTFEGNAAYVTTADVAGRHLALLSEEDFVAPSSTVRIDAPSTAAREIFACEAMYTLFNLADTAQIYRKPGSQLPGQIVYVGRGCPARGTTSAPIAADPYLADPTGKIVVVDGGKVPETQPNIATQACPFAARVEQAQAAGAIGVITAHRATAPFQASPFGISSGGNGGHLAIPNVTIDQSEGDSLRSLLCPSIDSQGACTGGATVTGALVDRPGEWGGLRVLDMSNGAAPVSTGVYRTPRSQVFPPPDLGVYSARQAVTRGTRAFVAWHADGVRVLDLTTSTPTEIASFVPPDTADPTGTVPAKAHVVGVDTLASHVVISDLNSGLYVLEFSAGYWSVAADGGVFSFGASDFLGSTGNLRLNAPVVGMAPTPSGRGYWLVASDGGIFAFGDARFHGSTGAIKLNQPVVGMATTPSGNGYWLVASDGGVFAFGDAGFHGSTGAIKLNRPVVGMGSTPSGKGYWLVASDGGVFAFGDARFHGSTGAIRLSQPVVGMDSTPSGKGYWLVASDGGVFAFGDARFHGSTGAIKLNRPVVGMDSTPSGKGYWLVASDGGIFAFGDAPFTGSTGNIRLNSPVVGMGAFPR